MLPYQSFKTLRLFGMALLYGYPGGGRFQSRRFVVPSSVPPRRGRADCLRPLRRRPSRPSCRYSYPASRSSLRPIRYDRRSGGSEASGRPAACSAGRRTGRMVSSWLSCIRSAACPMRSSDRSLPCRSFVSPPIARSVSSWCRRSPVFVMPAFQYRHASLHGRRGAGRGECLLGGAEMMMCVGLKKSGRGFRSPSACFGSIGCINLDSSRTGIVAC